MRRRALVSLLGSVTATWPLAARAQQSGKALRVGWIILGSPPGVVADIFSYYDSFRAGLTDLGYVDGSNIVLVARSAEGIPERLPGLIDELLREDVSVVVSPGPAIRVVREKMLEIDPGSLRLQRRPSCRGLCRYTVAWKGEFDRIDLYGGRT